MDDLATQLLSLLKRSSVSPDQKLAHLNSLKSNIKHQRVAEGAQAATVECVRIAVTTNTSTALVNTGFSTLGHLIKRLSLQEQTSALFGQRAGIEKALMERLGDQKEAYRNAASACLAELWSARPDTVEKLIRETAIAGSNVRAKEAGMAWVTKMHEEHQLQFRNFVSPIVECLDHADGTVRESAKTNLVELFKDAPDRAKIDLKRQLTAHNVRHSIASFILSQVNMPGHADAPTLAAPAHPRPASRAATPSHDPRLPDATNGAEPSLPPSAEAATIEPLYIDSRSELEDVIRSMQPCFEGKEDEGNWKTRDTNVLKLRRLNKGNAPHDYQANFVAGIKTLLDGILKVVNTLRTTMSTNGCLLVQELAQSLGPALDPMVEILLQNLVKMCSATKHISAQNGSVTVEIILNNLSYNSRLMHHIWAACQDKNVHPRTCAASWLKTIIKRQASSKLAFEHSGGLEYADKTVRKGLADPNPKVRESMRSTYWAYTAVWPDKGEAIMDTLDPKSKQLLAKDSSNPHKPSDFSSSVGSGAKSNPRAAAATRPSVRDAIAAQRKAALAVSRPNSAMADLSPVRHAPSTAPRHASVLGPSRAAARPGSSGSKTGAPAAASSGQGSLMSAPVRRPRRPDIPRPQTADPMHANQQFLYGDETPSVKSPVASPVRPVSKSSNASSVMSTHAKSKSANAIQPGQPGSPSSSRHSTPQTSPAKSRPKTFHAGTPTTSKSLLSPGSRSNDKDLTRSGTHFAGSRSTHSAALKASARRQSNSSSITEPNDDDNLTLVMPSKSGLQSTPAQATSNGATGVSEMSVDSHGAASQESLSIYEDPDTIRSQDQTHSRVRPAVLEELPMSEHNAVIGQPTPPLSPGSNPDERPLSPSKRAALRGEHSLDVAKSQRLLVSATQRLRVREVDAHGLRRLQDVIKAGSPELATQFAEVLKALLTYINQPPEAIDTNPTKAQGLKTQAIASIRAIASVHRSAPLVKQGYPVILCALISAKRLSDGNTAHIATELDRAANEIVAGAGLLTESCIDAVANVAESELRQGLSNKQHGVLPMALTVLAKLIARTQEQQQQQQADALDEERLDKLGQLAVRCLDDTDADVRRAATEFCLQFRQSFEPGGRGNTAFWEALQGVREAQANLVAYYLARRGTGAAGAVQAG